MVINERTSMLSLTKKKAEVLGSSTIAIMLTMHRALRSFMVVELSGVFHECVSKARISCYICCRGTKANQNRLMDSYTTSGFFFGTIQRC